VARDAPGARIVRRAQGELRAAELREQTIRRTMERDRARDLTQLRARVGLAMRTLAPREVETLRRAVSAPQVEAAIRLRRAVERLAPDHVRELAAWVRAPHRQLPTRAVQAFRGLIQDQDREMRRGLSM
jgi:hypothetical protein